MWLSVRRSVGRTFISRSSSNAPSLKATPQYSIFGENTLLSLKVIPPTFKTLRSGALVIDHTKKGRILLEWTPKALAGGMNRDGQVRFALSAEEVGFIVNQLPDQTVEFTRRSQVEMHDAPDKVLRITPMEGGQFNFAVDFELNGQGGQQVSQEVTGPLETVVQLGEYMVIRELMKTTIPVLVGWNTQMSIALNNAVHASQTNSSPYQDY